jgi:hypothetical protein
MAVGSMPQDARPTEERRASLDPSLADLLDTLALILEGDALEDAPELRAVTEAQLAAWGFRVQTYPGPEDDDGDEG